MKFKIGFSCETKEKEAEVNMGSNRLREVVPRKSVVQVKFPGWSKTLSYYNDRFDLQVGDFVYVEGKLAGQRGRVMEVNYNFKIRLSDYKRVIALADTKVKGKFYFAGSHFVTFDREVIPPEKVITWFKASSDGEEFISGSDDSAFFLNDLKGMKVSAEIVERGNDYYMGNKVLYTCVDGTKGYAIVEGSKPYEVEFEYCNGEVRCLTCSCYCGYNCKHEVAAMLQLKETLDKIEKSYGEEYENADCFAAIFKGTLLTFAVDGNNTGSFVLN